MKRPILFIPFILFLLAAPIRGTAQPRSITLDAALTMGLENSKSLHASRMRADYADARSSEMTAALFPTIRAQASYQRLSDIPAFTIRIPGNAITFPVILNNTTTKTTITQPVFTGWKLQGAADNAEYTANASHSEFEKDRQELLYAVKSAYWAVYRAQESRRLAGENVGQIAQHATDIEHLFAQGTATTNDVLKTKVQLSNAKLALSIATNNVRLVTISFNSMVGLPLGTEVVIGTPLTPVTKEFSGLQELLAEAAAKRPDMRGSEWRMKAASSGVTAARGAWFPQIALNASYYYSRPNQRLFPAVDQFRDTWDVGLSVSWDLWNNLATLRQTQSAQALEAQAEDAYGILRDAITLDVTQSLFTFTQAKENIALANLSVEQAQENLRVTQEKFRSGLTTNSELLDAEYANTQARLQLVQANVDFELAQAKLEKAVGKGI